MFRGTGISHSNLLGADLSGVDIRGARLVYVENLECHQLNSAKIDRKTKLPDHIQITWISGSDFECAEI